VAKQSYWDTAAFGKRQEYAVIAELLRRGFDVYQTLVDDKGIDCVLRVEAASGLRYVDVQIKARSRDAGMKSWGDWPAIRVSARPNYVFIFYSEPLRKTWVVRSTEIISRARLHKKDDLDSGYDVKLAKLRSPRGAERAFFEETPEVTEFLGAFSLLARA